MYMYVLCFSAWYAWLLLEITLKSIHLSRAIDIIHHRYNTRNRIGNRPHTPVDTIQIMAVPSLETTPLPQHWRGFAHYRRYLWQPCYNQQVAPLACWVADLLPTRLRFESVLRDRICEIMLA